MKYVKVKWIHDFLDEPMELYSELDDQLWEKRKIEIYADGRRDYASKAQSSGSTKLSICQLPPSAEISLDPQFIVLPLSAKSFEELWSAAVGRVAK
jgi:hypothetical protein